MQTVRKETVVYGGAFNPPTLAHQAIVGACATYAKTRGADVWLLPSASRRDKAIDTSRECRLELLEALVRDSNEEGVNMHICTVELDHPVPTQTYDTVEELCRSYPNRRFVWVFGTDSLVTMPHWHGGEWLYRHLPMLIVERSGSLCPLLGENATYLGITTGGISSTEVRRRLVAGEAYDELVSPQIAALLAKRGACSIEKPATMSGSST